MNCPKCGNPADGTFSFCEYCGNPLRQQEPTCEQKSDWQPNYGQQLYQQAAYYQPPKSEKRENVVAGIVGAFIGALIGAVVIVLLSRIGFIAAISGLVLAVCTLKGYELLGGKLSTKGIIICVVLMLVTPYLADRIDWAIIVMEE